MTSTKRVPWFMAVIAAFSILILTRCDGSGGELIYRAGGTASEAEVAYTDAEGVVHEETVTLPWEKDVEFREQIEYELRVRKAGPTGDVACEVWLEDRLLGDGESTAYVVCMGSVYLEPGNPQFFSSYSAESQLSTAQRFLEEDDLEKALSAVEIALDMAPSFAQAHYLQGRVYGKLEKPNEAVEAYTEAIALDPDLTGAHYNRGWIYLDRGEYDLAVAGYTATLELNPQYSLAYKHRAIANYALGQLEAVRADLLKVLELSDDPELQEWAEGALSELDDTE